MKLRFTLPFLSLLLGLTVGQANAQTTEEKHPLSFDDGQTDTISITHSPKERMSISTFNFLGVQLTNHKPGGGVNTTAPILLELNQQWLWNKNGLELSVLSSPFDNNYRKQKNDNKRLFLESEIIYKREFYRNIRSTRRFFNLSNNEYQEDESVKVYRVKLSTPVEDRIYVRSGFHYLQNTTSYEMEENIGGNTYAMEVISQATPSVFLGLSRQSTQVLNYNTNDLGNKAYFRRMDFYIDAFYAPINSSYTLITDESGNAVNAAVENQLLDQLQLSHFGVRVGGAYRKSWSNGKIASAITYEASFLPGMEKNNLILSLGYGLSLISIKE